MAIVPVFEWSALLLVRFCVVQTNCCKALVVPCLVGVIVRAAHYSEYLQPRLHTSLTNPPRLALVTNVLPHMHRNNPTTISSLGSNSSLVRPTVFTARFCMQSIIVKISPSSRLLSKCSNNITGESVWARESSRVLKDEEDRKESDSSQPDEAPVSAFDYVSSSGTGSTSSSSSRSSYGGLVKAASTTRLCCRGWFRVDAQNLCPTRCRTQN